MRYGLAVSAAALCLALTAATSAASATTRVTPPTTACSSSVVFGEPQWRARTMTFRAAIDIACPLGVPFSAALRSSNGCELRSSSGSALRYELFADEAMHSAVVSCERATAALSGTGRRSFVVYGRVAGPVGAIGQFHDALVMSIAP